MIDIKIGDCRKLIHSLDDESIDMVMTSPPYWGLRDYKTEPIIFDGLPDCEHEWGDNIVLKKCGKPTQAVGIFEGRNLDGIQSQKELNQGSFCSKCGAWRGQLGLEPTPELYIKHMLDFFDDVKLKLKAEGNCFVNLGDTYGTQSGSMAAGKLSDNGSHKLDYDWLEHPMLKGQSSIVKHKCLCMIPQRFAWGMIERGWILRNEIIWSKPNHMPESVTDRLTKAHEVIYHFVKQQKYYYNLDAIRDEQSPNSHPYGKNGSFEINIGSKTAPTWGIDGTQSLRGKKFHRYRNPNGKNPGDVWSISPTPYSGSHFAVFPLELVRRPILAGCPIGGTVLDPFGGSGTIGEFCRHNDRNAILFELNPEYVKLIKERSMANIPELDRFV